MTTATTTTKLGLNDNLQCLHVLLQSDTDSRQHEIVTLEHLSTGMNGSSDGSAAAAAPPGAGTHEPEPLAAAEPERYTHNHYNGASPPLPNGDASSSRGRGSTGSDERSLSPSAVRERTQAGKSGRVIEKLMAENDRLKRELKVETTARAEERKAKEAIQQSRDSLQSTNDNLIHQNNVDRASLARKDRVIAELRSERDYERSLRTTAESDLNVQVKNYDSTVHDLKTALSHETSERKRAINQYEVLQQSWKHLDEGYRTRVERLRAELDAMQAEHTQDHDVLKRLEVTIEQQRQELEKLRSAKNRITEKCEETIAEAEIGTREILDMARNREKVMQETTDAAKEALGQLRHVMAVKRDLRPDKEPAE